MSLLLLVSLILGVAVLSFLALWQIPKRQVKELNSDDARDKFDKENEARKTIAQILGGAVLLIGLYFTWQQVTVSQEGLITERFTRATDQIGSNSLEVRVGGIYAFQRIAWESEEDVVPVVEILATYVRENAPIQQVASILTCPRFDAPWADQTDSTSSPHMRIMRYGSCPLKPAVEEQNEKHLRESLPGSDYSEPRADVQAALLSLVRISRHSRLHRY